MRTDRLNAYLAATDLEAVWFARPDNFAWLTGGNNVVDRGSEVGVAAAGYDGEVRAVTDTIEADRLRQEELPDGIDVDEFAWHEGTLAGAVAERSPKPGAADFPVPGLERVDAGPLRRPLTSDDVDRYRELGRETAAAVESVCRAIDPTDTERRVAADLGRRLAEDGIETRVALVGGAERAPRYRHYTPTDAAVGGYALVSITARRDGLHASCTRTVASDPPAWLADRHEAATRIEAAALDATRRAAADNGSAGDVFASIREAYADAGWPDEWRRHHQGGATGYAGREWIARPGCDAAILTPMAYAWNPTVEGAKSEDTVLLAGGAIEVLTGTGEWPARSVSVGGTTIDRPAILRR